MKKFLDIRAAVTGLVSGAANGFFGSGGGIIAVPMLEGDGTETKKAHATSLGIMLPISLVSAFVYFSKGSLDIGEALKYLPGGMLGVYVGSVLMKKISSDMLKKLFAAVMIYFGVRMIM